MAPAPVTDPLWYLLAEEMYRRHAAPLHRAERQAWIEGYVLAIEHLMNDNAIAEAIGVLPSSERILGVGE